MLVLVRGEVGWQKALQGWADFSIISNLSIPHLESGVFRNKETWRDYYKILKYLINATSYYWPMRSPRIILPPKLWATATALCYYRH